MLKYCSPLVLVLALITAVVASDNAPTTPSGSEAPEKEKVEKEGELIDFKAIKEVLKNDGLQNSADKKSDEVKQAGAIRQYKDQNRFSIPDAANFWPFFSEYWLIKNAPILKWDFQKPDYGIEESLEKLLEQTGFFEKKFKILLMDGPNVCHFALPSGEKEIIFLLSVPFIRAMDLSKTEIALLLFEDFIRLQKNYFVETVATPALKEMLGGNFFEKTLDKKIFSELLKKYDELIFAKGFSRKLIIWLKQTSCSVTIPRFTLLLSCKLGGWFRPKPKTLNSVQP